MKQRISIINKSTGKFTIETINNREHLVTTMMVIEGDSVMNELFYPNSVVNAAAGQLEMLPAPDRHPNVNGQPVSAFNPLAINAQNFGGFTRSPRTEGKKTFTDLVIDLEVANKLDRGRKIIKKIKNGERIGVSTGLIADISNASGKVGKQKFNGTVEMIQFDHVAVLLDEAPAGDNTFTINHDRKLTKTLRSMQMDEITIDLTSLALEDRIKLSELTVNQLLSHVNHEVSIDEAKVIVTKAGLNFYQTEQSVIDNFLANQEGFEAYQAAQLKTLNETKDFILANTKMDKDQLSEMSVETLNSLAKSVAPKNTYVAPNGKLKNNELELLDDVNMKVGE